MPRGYGGVFTKTQRKALAAFMGGPREHEANNRTNLVLERKGLLRRLTGPRASKWASHFVIEWEITAEGLTTLDREDAVGSSLIARG